MNARLTTTSLLSPSLLGKLRDNLGGAWNVEAKQLDVSATQESDFVRLSTDYADFTGHQAQSLLARDPVKAKQEESLADSAEDKFVQTRKDVGEPVVAQLKDSLEFAREGLLADDPSIRSSLQPYQTVDFGDGVLGFNMGFTYPLFGRGGGNAISDRGLLVIDTTPNEDGMTAVWAHRS